MENYKLREMKNILTIGLIFIISSLYSQDLRVYSVQNTENKPRLEWYQTGKDLKEAKFSVWRTAIKANVFDSIQTLHYVDTRKTDTLIYTVLDTTLTKKALYKYYILLEQEDKRAMASPVVFGHNMGYIPSPRVVSLKVNSSKTKKAIDLTWKLNHNFSVRTLSLFRSSHHEKDFVKIAELAGDETSYTDNVPLSNHNYFYFILIADYFGYQQPSVPTPGFCSFKQKPLAPKNFSLHQNDSLMLLSWQNIESSLSGYKVYRSVGKEQFRPLHVTQISSKLKQSLTDTVSLPTENDCTIRYYVVNVGDSFMDSQTSDTLGVFFKRKVKPLPPTEMDAIVQKNNQVKLMWPLVKKGNVIGYNIYITTPKLQKLNKQLIPPKQNFFIDKTMRKSDQYGYAVESVGKDRDVSKFMTKALATILSPYFKLVVDSHKSKEAFEIIWKALPTNQIVNIKLYRQEEEQTPVLLQKFDNVDATFADDTLDKDKVYFYSLYADLNNGESIMLNNRISVKW